MALRREEDNEKVKLLREKCNHDLLKSEDEYVNMLEVIVKNVFKPLHEHSEKLRLKPQHVQYVYLFLEHMLQFHMNFLSVIRDALNIVPDFHKYGNFVQMYDDYLGRFDSVLKVFAEWKSMEFRSFASMRLENEKVKKCIEAPMLCMLPWYLYHPFDRLKIYYKFLRDLESLAQEGDDDKSYWKNCWLNFEKCITKSNKVKYQISNTNFKDHGKLVVCTYIQLYMYMYIYMFVCLRKHITGEKRLRTKTKLLEIQLQIHGDFKTIVRDDRYFIS
ncbi:hypothetical protein RFI_22834 [Reticulomyxa filosa]|uniref:DH domain-containing protein n=1 Tax=Reticulomyxa filosa TaxID=46433 RepID=X6MLK6_RETFI|nr:hypothetical protein RFI_22834 [Reticulomyxa filosa]|eukprot:ETO14531.1 hypothetical protein RFI_22834 [Reticulomyxa filosa]